MRAFEWTPVQEGALKRSRINLYLIAPCITVCPHRVLVVHGHCVVRRWGGVRGGEPRVFGCDNQFQLFVFQRMVSEGPLSMRTL